VRRTKTLLTLSLGLALLALAMLPARAEDPRAALDRFLAEVESLEAEFTQTLYDEEGTLVEASEGLFQLQRPDRFRWSYRTPYVQEIVADGDFVWIYDPELAQVTVKPLAEALGSTPALLLSGSRGLEEAFTLRPLDRGPLAWLELAPRNPESVFAAIRLGLDDAMLQRMELVDNFGQTTELTFEIRRVNPDLPDGTFRFDVPEGVDVVRDAP
jgi:outer membrane lipoprotein carrier protein